MSVQNLPTLRIQHRAWNKGRIEGQKRPLPPSMSGLLEFVGSSQISFAIWCFITWPSTPKLSTPIDWAGKSSRDCQGDMQALGNRPRSYGQVG